MSYAGGTLGDFVATGVGAAVQVPEVAAIKVSITGTFVGTVAIQISFDGVAFVAFDTETGPGLVPTGDGVTLPPIQALRAECTAFTSGTIEVRFGARSLVASNQLTAVS